MGCGGVVNENFDNSGAQWRAFLITAVGFGGGSEGRAC